MSNGSNNSSNASRRFNNAGEAAKELFDGFNDWSGAIGSYGIQTAYALIAANWAVYGNAQKILTNGWAKASMIVVIGFLGVHLLCIGWMALLYKNRCSYANKNKDKWKKEFEQENDESSPWPYTTFIHKLGGFIHIMKVFAPVIGGILFIIGLLSGGNNMPEPVAN